MLNLQHFFRLLSKQGEEEGTMWSMNLTDSIILHIASLKNFEMEPQVMGLRSSSLTQLRYSRGITKMCWTLALSFPFLA